MSTSKKPNKRYYSYKTLKEKTEAVGSKLLTTEEEYNKNKDDYAEKKLKLILECVCGNKQNKTALSITQTKPICGVCNKAQKKPRENDKAYREMTAYLDEFGTKIITSANVYNAIPIPGRQKNTKVLFECVCGKRGEKTFAALRATPSCNSCNRSKKDTTNTYETFCDMLEMREWTMISEKKEFENDKTNMTVICSKGHVTETTFARVKNTCECRFCLTEGKKGYTIESLQELFSRRGCLLLEEEYINNNTKMQYVCVCGTKANTTLHDFAKRTYGCLKCKTEATKISWEIIQGYFEKSGCTLISTKETYQNNMSKLEYVCYCGGIGNTCWKLFVYQNVRCGECTDARRRATCVEKYGVENVSQSQHSKNKTKEAFTLKYGVDHNMKTKECVELSKETNKKSHGGVHNLATQKIREMAIVAHIEKYGAPPGFVESIREKMKASTKERYGQEYYAHSVDYKKRMMELYGVEFPMQSPIIFSKMMASCFRKKLFTFPSAKAIYVQGYEHFALKDLLEEGIQEEDIIAGDDGFGEASIPIIKYKNASNKDAVYFPDIFIPSKNLIIEIKSTYTYFCDKPNNVLKFQACVDSGYNIEFRVYNHKGNYIRTFDNDGGSYTTKEWRVAEERFNKKNEILCDELEECLVD